jgi:adenosylcobinamide-phosphate synthase
MTVLSLAVAVALDLFIGDPGWLPHPIRWMGRLVGYIERRLYPKERSSGRDFMAGVVTCVTVTGITMGTGCLFFTACSKISPWAAIIGEAIIGFYCLAARSLAQESGTMLKVLRTGDMPASRTALSMIVGRDTDQLDEQSIVRATVETVAENITDGIVSPLFYLALGGPVVALGFKAVSTMDSMIGYRNERYRYFGTCAARLDDALNFVPARLTGFILIPLAAAILGFDAQKSLCIVKRDRLKHESPNSAHGEAAVAGALGIQLGGEARYQGVVSNKPSLGNPSRNIEPQDIARSIKILYGVTVLGAGMAISWLFVWNRLGF